MIEILSVPTELPPIDTFSEVFLAAPRATILVASYHDQFAFLVHPKGTTIPLGDHYHTGTVKEKNPERIHVVSGSWKILAQPVDQTGRLTGDPIEYTAQAGQSVIVPPFTWHALYAETSNATLMELYGNKEDYIHDIHRLLEIGGTEPTVLGHAS